MTPRMKHLMVISIAGSILVLLIYVFAVKISSKVASKVDSSKAPASRTTKGTKETNVSFAGIVKETTDTTIVVERTVKDEKETLEFALDKAVVKIKAGDKVKVSYIKKEGMYIAKQVALVLPKMTIKKVTPAKVVKQDAHW